jgi:hypothetical protein
MSSAVKAQLRVHPVFGPVPLAGAGCPAAQREDDRDSA